MTTPTMEVGRARQPNGVRFTTYRFSKIARSCGPRGRQNLVLHLPGTPHQPPGRPGIAPKTRRKTRHAGLTRAGQTVTAARTSAGSRTPRAYGEQGDGLLLHDPGMHPKEGPPREMTPRRSSARRPNKRPGQGNSRACGHSVVPATAEGS